MAPTGAPKRHAPNKGTDKESHKKATNSQSHTKSFIYIASLMGIISYGSVYYFKDSIQTRLLSLYYDKSDQTSRSADEIGHRSLEEAVRPFGGIKSFNLDPILSRDQLPFWGTLNSGHYFSQRIDVPQSIESGLMWFHNKLNDEHSLDIRFWCNQNDKLDKYAWNRHNFYDFGEQTLVDGNYTIFTTFVKNRDEPTEWNAEITLTHKHQDEEHLPLSLIYYVVRESDDDALAVESARAQLPKNHDVSSPVTMVEFRTRNNRFGQYRLSIDLLEGHENFVYGNFLKANVTRSKQKLNYAIMQNLLMTKHEGNLLYIFPGNKDLSEYNSEWKRVENPNLVSYQLMLKAPAKFRVRMKPFTGLPNDNERMDFTAQLDKRREEFDAKFESIFPIHDGTDNEHMIDAAQVALSNMIGSIGYSYGHSEVTSDHEPNQSRPYGPIQLLTGVPSRSFFPRGFLWDEGFHNLIIGLWDPELSVKIIKSWFNMMNLDGWIPREVILGDESRQRVPAEFIVQKLSNANPPAMFLAIESLVDRKAISKADLNDIFPKLKSWFRWFNSTQTGQKTGTYRWRGRDQLSNDMLNAKTLTSGLDDFPRASHASDDEYHLDLRCWIALGSRTMFKISQMVDSKSDAQIYRDQYEYLKHNQLLEKLHWSNEHEMFCDFGHNTPKVSLVKTIKQRKTYGGNVETYVEYVRRVDESPRFGCVPEFGYVSLFPFIAQILESNNPKLGIILQQLADPERLWSPWGIRSLSQSSVYYHKYNTQHDPPYWRGSIWVNVNYLILRSLNHYAKSEGPYRERSEKLYNELRHNLIRTVLSQYKITNYMWENYDDITGHGKGSHPFTGWTSLILLIMSNQV